MLGCLLHLMEVEDQIELADIAEVVVQNLHKQVNRLQICELIVRHIYAEAEVQPGISPVDDLVRLELQTEPVAELQAAPAPMSAIICPDIKSQLATPDDILTLPKLSIALFPHNRASCCAESRPFTSTKLVNLASLAAIRRCTSYSRCLFSPSSRGT